MVVVMGTSGCGKSKLIQAVASHVDGDLELQEWDSVGAVPESADLVLGLFDLTDPKSLARLTTAGPWACPTVLVGTKLDLWDKNKANTGKHTTRQDAAQCCQETGAIGCVWTSSQTKHGICTEDSSMELYQGQQWDLSSLITSIHLKGVDAKALASFSMVDVEWAVGTDEYDWFKKSHAALGDARAELTRAEQARRAAKSRVDALQSEVATYHAMAVEKAARVQLLRKRVVARWQKDKLRVVVLDWSFRQKFEKQQAENQIRFDASTLIIKRAVARWMKDSMRIILFDWNAHMRLHFKLVKKKYEQEAAMLLMKRAYVRWQTDSLRKNLIYWNTQMIEYLAEMKRQELARKKAGEEAATMIMRRAVAKWQKDATRILVLTWREQVLDHFAEIRRAQEEKRMLVEMERQYMKTVFDKTKSTWRALAKTSNQHILAQLESFWPDEGLSWEFNQEEFETKFYPLVKNNPSAEFDKFDINHDGLISRWEFFKEMDNRLALDKKIALEWLEYLGSVADQLSPKPSKAQRGEFTAADLP